MECQNSRGRRPRSPPPTGILRHPLRNRWVRQRFLSSAGQNPPFSHGSLLRSSRADASLTCPRPLNHITLKLRLPPCLLLAFPVLPHLPHLIRLGVKLPDSASFRLWKRFFLLGSVRTAPLRFRRVLARQSLCLGGFTPCPIFLEVGPGNVTTPDLPLPVADLVLSGNSVSG